MFETALKLKFRFDTDRGQISTEDLWDLPLSSRNGFDLDTVAKGLAKKIRETSEESFVKTASSSSKELEVKLEIVKYIIQEKLMEAEVKEQAKIKESQRSLIQSVIAEKQVDSLKSKTIEELNAML